MLLNYRQKNHQCLVKTHQEDDGKMPTRLKLHEENPTIQSDTDHLKSLSYILSAFSNMYSFFC